MPIFEFMDIWFRYDNSDDSNNWILKEIYFSVEEGDFIIILGHNGCGKTTLLKHFNGLLKPQRGEIIFKGKTMKSYKLHELFFQVGFLFQDPNDQIFAPTVEQDVAFGPLNLGLSEKDIEERVNDALRTVDMLSLKKEKIHRLSFGQRQRVALAGVLANKPSIIVLDEPTSALDPATQIEIMDLLKKLNQEEGKTIILATHDIEYIAEYSTKMIVLSNGTIVHNGDPQELFKRREILNATNLRLPLISVLCMKIADEKGLKLQRIPLTLQESIDFLRNLSK